MVIEMMYNHQIFSSLSFSLIGGVFKVGKSSQAVTCNNVNENWLTTSPKKVRGGVSKLIKELTDWWVEINPKNIIYFGKLPDETIYW